MAYFSGSVNPVYVRLEVAPVTGSTTVLALPFDMLCFTNTATTAAQTVVLPVKPADGQKVYICNNGAITTLTLTIDASVGQTAFGAPGGLAVGQGLELMYSGTQNAWFTVKS